jgi:hypothetical protein
LIWLAGQPRGISVKTIVAITLVTIIVFHGMHFPAEAHIRTTALRIARTLAICQPQGPIARPR